MLRSRYFGLATHTHSFAAALLGEGAWGKLMCVYTNFDLKQLPPNPSPFCPLGLCEGGCCFALLLFCSCCGAKKHKISSSSLKGIQELPIYLWKRYYSKKTTGYGEKNLDFFPSSPPAAEFFDFFSQSKTRLPAVGFNGRILAPRHSEHNTWIPTNKPL